MEKEKKIKILVDYINRLFAKLRGDWSDNRWACREGWEAVSRLKVELGEQIDKPYQHNEGETEDAYYERIMKPLEED